MKKIIGILSSFAPVLSISTTVAYKINKRQGNNNNNPLTLNDNSVGSEIDISLFEANLKKLMDLSLVLIVQLQMHYF